MAVRRKRKRVTQRTNVRLGKTALKKLGFSVGTDGRARKDGQFVSQKRVQDAISRDRRKRQKTKLLVKLERVTTESQRKRFTVDKAAKWTGRSPRTIKRWISSGSTPPEALDVIQANLTGERVYSERWKHGRKSKVSSADEKDVAKKLKAFVQAVESNSRDAKEKHAAWYQAKEKIRKQLTMKAWRKKMKAIGKKEKLADEGKFSIERFMLS